MKRKYSGTNGYRKKPFQKALIGPRMQTGAFYSKRQVVPGFTRTGGNYARFGYSAARMGLTPEVKSYDIDPFTFSFDSTMELANIGVSSMLAIAQGTSGDTRDGRAIFVKSVQIRGTMNYAPAAGAVTGATAFMYLVLDSQANGAVPAVSEIFTSTAAETNHLLIANSGRFRILKRWIQTFNSPSGVTTAYNNVRKQIEFYKRCNIKVEYNTTGGALTDIKSNHLFLVAGSVGGDDLISFTGSIRLRFIG